MSMKYVCVTYVHDKDVCMDVKYMCVMYVHDDDDGCVCMGVMYVHVCVMYVHVCVWRIYMMLMICVCVCVHAEVREKF